MRSSAESRSTPDVSQDAGASVRLTHLATLDIKGEGAEKFLQGQTSAQVNLADDHFAPLTCFCTPKGRMIANGQLIRLNNEHLRLLLSASLVEPLMAHLKKFAPFYRVELTPGEPLTILGVTLDEAQKIATAFDMPLPANSWQQVSDASHRSILAYPASAPEGADDYRWLFILPSADAEAFSSKDELANWQLADIRRGLVWLNAEQQDKYLPQMINWEALGGISFKKGCYTGQEVVARAHFRGQVKKRLWLGSVAIAEALPDGTEVKDDTDRSVGEIVTSCAAGDATTEFLAIINTRAIENEVPLSISGHPVTLTDLPYPLERLDPEQVALTITTDF
ncbi:CAF17-like 4Fe-4S cluster assembly/insertion protein YgfZ [Halomonas sp. LS-001]